MNRLFRMQTWPFLTQLGVFTLATAVVSGLGAWLVGWHTPITAAHPSLLVGLVGTSGLACCLFRSLMQQGNRQVHEQICSLIQFQAAHIAESTSTIDELAADSIELAASIRQAAESAMDSATVAEQVLMNIQQGIMTVESTCQCIQDTGTQGRDVARRLQHLGGHSQEVDKIGQLIGDFADRTNVLALNVSVQATKAGVMGQECVVAAAEVEHLSGRTTEATRRITHLAHTIQRETHEVAIALEESTREMAQWVQAAAQAGRSLKEIEGVSSRLAELIQALVRETKQQSGDATTLSKAMAEQSAVTHQALVDAQQAVTALDDLLTPTNHEAMQSGLQRRCLTRASEKI
jgi:methyl-accepting chemotaxis protein PixJ